MYVFIHTHKGAHTDVQREGREKFILKKMLKLYQKNKTQKEYFSEKIHFVNP